MEELLLHNEAVLVVVEADAISESMAASTPGYSYMLPRTRAFAAENSSSERTPAE